jgi:glycosyltransferase involved in cell wall biosynthesis
MTLISIVTPSYNQGSYIRSCLRSTRRAYDGGCNVEHIVFDNLSTDETPALLKEFEGAGFLRYFILSDKGQSDALNRAIREARAEWVLWLNADDFMLPGAIETLAKYISSDPPFDVIYGHTLFVDGNDMPVREVRHIPYWYPMSFFRVYTPPTSGTLFRRSVLLEDPLDERYHYTMDTEWFLRVGSRVRVKQLNELIVAFRVIETSKTGGLTLGQGVNKRHLEEREAYWETHIEPRLARVPAYWRSALWLCGHYIWRGVYYLAKSRHVTHYALAWFRMHLRRTQVYE